jgi:hypothetical protein
MRLRLLALLIFALMSAAFAQGGEASGTLRGVVHDINGAVVPGVRVVIQGWKSDMKNTGRVTYTIESALLTDSKGEFSSSLQSGRYDVFVSYPILLPIAKRVKIEANRETTVELELKDDPQIAGLVY